MGVGQPANKVPTNTFPVWPPLLTPATYHMPPLSQQSLAEHPKTGRFSWNRIILVVASDDRLEPFPGLHYRFVHPQPKLLFQSLKFRPHPLLYRLALHHKIARFPILPAPVRESQKVERLRLSFSSLTLVPFGIFSELYPARFLWVQLQAELSQPFP